MMRQTVPPHEIADHFGRRREVLGGALRVKPALRPPVERSIDFGADGVHKELCESDNFHASYGRCGF
jgi:hypothetical protein